MDSADVRLVKSTKTESCVVAFATEAHLLAAGSQSGSGTGGTPRLRILRTNPIPYRDDAHLIDPPVAEFSGSPAPFSCICWSDPMATGFSSCPAGLIAGGLESGAVAVWDPSEALREKRDLEADETSVPWISDFGMEEEYWAPQNQRKPPASPGLFEHTSGNLVAADSIRLDDGPVAVFARHATKVCGIGFSPHSPNLLASAAGHGRIYVWDLAKTSAESVATWQAQSTDGEDISWLSWSPRLPNIVGSTSCSGVSIWDISSRTAIKVRKFPRECSGVEFSQINDNFLVVSCGDWVDAPALSVWDMRKMENPVSEMCSKSKGVAAMALSPHHADILLVSTKNDFLSMWSLPEQKMIWSQILGSRCHNVHWSQNQKGFFAAATDKELSLLRLLD